MKTIKSIEKSQQIELNINKSKFIACSFYVQNLLEVEEILSNLKNEYKDATHICYAYSIYPAKEKAVDDGEPQGTAGKPILDCIKKAGFQNVLIAVVRYFGGIKLGAGGLTRAYSQSASSVLAISGQNLTYECIKLTFNISLAESKLLSQIKNLSLIKKIETSYLEKIKIDIFVEKSDLENLKNQIENILKNQVDFVVFNEIYFV